MKERVVIFGAWNRGVNLYFAIMGKQEVIAFSDNNRKLWGMHIYDKKVVSPEELKDMQYDYIYIASSSYGDIRIQLRSLGIKENKIKIMATKSDVEYTLNIYEECTLNNNEKYEFQWQELRKKYNQIFLFRLDVSAIGETIARIQKAIDDNKKSNSDDLRVFIPDPGRDKRICNSSIFSLIQKSIYIVDEREISFWKWVLENHFGEVNLLEYNRYLYRGHIDARIMNKENIPFTFTEEQIQMGKRKLSEMGVKEEFVCVVARSSNYGKSTLKNYEWNVRAHEHRNADFSTYSSTINYLKMRKLQAVRMGRGEKPIPEIDNCVDYAGGGYADDFMDFFLLSKCKFMLTGVTGIFAVATAFAKPILMVNVANISFGCGGLRYTKDDMYIPKKYYDVNKKRYLSIRELAEIESYTIDNAILYAKYGIQFIDNTQEEILDATEEMLLRLEGKWRDSEEDIKYYNKYQQIMKEVSNFAKKNARNWLGEGIVYKISMRYLRNNLYLLE